MSKFNKRATERKGENKERENDMRLIREHSDELVNPGALEPPDEPATED